MEWLTEWENVDKIELVTPELLGGCDWALGDEATLGLSTTYIYKLYHSQDACWAISHGGGSSSGSGGGGDSDSGIGSDSGSDSGSGSGSGSGSSSSQINVRSRPPSERHALSLVALIATTEHLTAVNVRKELVRDGLRSGESELRLLDVLLGSPLHKHAKSPLLWAHRRWLVREGHVAANLDREMAIVARAAASHPKNYYAWSYARGLVNSATREKLGNWAWELCRRNVSDTSMWNFLALVAPERAADAALLAAEYPHEAIAAYLRLVPSADQGLGPAKARQPKVAR